MKFYISSVVFVLAFASYVGGGVPVSVALADTQSQQCVSTSVETLSAGSVATSSAIIYGNVTAGSVATYGHLEYGKTQNFGTITATQFVNILPIANLAVTITGLQPDTTYYYRVVADNGCGGASIIGQTGLFTTLSLPVQATSTALIPLTVDLKVNGVNGPLTLLAGDPVNLSWSSSGGNSCLVVNGWNVLTVAATGSVAFAFPSTSSTTYLFSCTASDGRKAEDSVVVQLSVPTAPTSTPTTTPQIASTTSNTVSGITQTLLDQIKILQAEVVRLVALLAARQGSGSTTASIQTITRDLSYGMMDEAQVRVLQTALTKQGFYAGPITGNFFSMTREAVKAFQLRYGIFPDGTVGSATRDKLNSLISL